MNPVVFSEFCEASVNCPGFTDAHPAAEARMALKDQDKPFDLIHFFSRYIAAKECPIRNLGWVDDDNQVINSNWNILSDNQ